MRLGALHVLSPEFDPSWRMVSEYANGHFGRVLPLMFLAWGIASWALAAALRPYLRGWAGSAGLGLLVISGVGEAMASVFDINHAAMHSLAGVLGVLPLPAAALLISHRLGRSQPWQAMRGRLAAAAHLTWISLVALFASLAAMGISFVRGGGHPPKSGMSLPPNATLPPGTIAWVGWASRLLV